MNKLDNLQSFGYRKVDEHARSACSCRSLRPDYCSFAPKREGMPETANNLSIKARELRCQAMDVCQVHASTMGSGEGSHRRSDDSLKGPRPSRRQCHARHIKKIIVKACARKPQARFERGLMETGWR